MVPHLNSSDANLMIFTACRLALAKYPVLGARPSKICVLQYVFLPCFGQNSLLKRCNCNQVGALMKRIRQAKCKVEKLVFSYQVKLCKFSKAFRKLGYSQIPTIIYKKIISINEMIIIHLQKR
jgi:hypothetical protein